LQCVFHIFVKEFRIDSNKNLFLFTEIKIKVLEVLSKEIEQEISRKQSDLNNLKEEIGNLQEYKDIISLIGDISLKDIIESLINKGKNNE